MWQKCCGRSDTFKLIFRLDTIVEIVSLFLDLRWVQVNNAEEAYKVLIFGKKNQSFSATRLNQLSSRRWYSVFIRTLANTHYSCLHVISSKTSPPSGGFLFCFRIISIHHLPLYPLAGLQGPEAPAQFTERQGATWTGGQFITSMTSRNMIITKSSKCSKNFIP